MKCLTERSLLVCQFFSCIICIFLDTIRVGLNLAKILPLFQKQDTEKILRMAATSSELQKKKTSLTCLDNLVSRECCLSDTVSFLLTSSVRIATCPLRLLCAGYPENILIYVLRSLCLTLMFFFCLFNV